MYWQIFCDKSERYVLLCVHSVVNGSHIISVVELQRIHLSVSQSFFCSYVFQTRALWRERERAYEKTYSICNFVRITVAHHPTSRCYMWLTHRQTFWAAVYWYAATCQSIKLTECPYPISLRSIFVRMYFFSLFSVLSSVLGNVFQSQIMIGQIFIFFSLSILCKAKQKYPDLKEFSVPKSTYIDLIRLFWFVWSTFCNRFHNNIVCVCVMCVRCSSDLFTISKRFVYTIQKQNFGGGVKKVKIYMFTKTMNHKSIDAWNERLTLN